MPPPPIIGADVESAAYFPAVVPVVEVDFILKERFADDCLGLVEENDGQAIVTESL